MDPQRCLEDDQLVDGEQTETLAAHVQRTGHRHYLVQAEAERLAREAATAPAAPPA